MKRMFVAATGTVVATLALAAASPMAGATSTGPSYGKFTVSFPSAPKSESNTSEVMAGFPSGARSATAYWVSPASNPLKSSGSAPPAPSYLVVVGQAKSVKQAKSFTASVKKVPGAKAIHVNGAAGYRYVGTEKQLSQGTTKDPTATEAFTYLTKGATMYAIIVIDDSQAKALSFLSSFRPA